jgi:hypothetical protein
MRIQHREHACDIAIIGGGLGGLAAAETLSNRFPEISISVFEGSHHTGGRIRSKPLKGEAGGDLDVVELGAGRHHLRRHRRLQALIDDLGLATYPFHYRIRRRTPGADGFPIAETFEILNALRSTTPEGTSFKAAVEDALGGGAFDRLVAMSGYDTLRRDELPFRHGLEIISSHPETESLWVGQTGEWRGVAGGFSRVAEALGARVRERHPIFLDHRVSRLVYRDGVVAGFEATGPRGEVSVEADRVICATSLYDLLALYPAACRSIDYSADIVDVPLAKGYIEFEEAFWSAAEAEGLGECVIVPGAFRKVYLSASRPRLFFYCDGASALELKRRLGSMSLPDLFAEQAGTILPGVDGRQLKVRRSGWRWWDRGISFWSGGVQRVPGPVWAPEPNLYFLSDINTGEVGWMEGALLAAEALGKLIDTDSPTPASITRAARAAAYGSVADDYPKGR